MTANDLVAKAQNLPSVSNAATRLVGLLDSRAGADNEEVVQVIKCDSVLTAKLLRTCNSPYFGFTQKVLSVDQAVLILGHQEILHIVLTLGFGGAMSASLPGYAVESNELWRHSLTTAMAGEIVANSGLGLDVDPPVAFTVGLLHDIGKLVLSQYLTSELQTAIRRKITNDSVSRVEAEREILETDHGEVGARLLQTWNLPEEIVEAVANHHQPIVKPRPRLSAVAHLANCMAHLGGSAPGWESFAVRVDNQLMESLDITPGKLESMIITVRDSSERVDQFMAMA